ncbi:hypothetical protein RZA67_09760 [Stenotrophomonas sp. C3(2023)]|uniref:hypothetical protein n=1 Tax=Stenotrophomonas sp. C3(2023) TaxID=3080277 RepID=UPI00293CE62C|nr:hypothetical protein [Stenotrophomonas sp. C3(2023)]MDV3469014.1 hypothetical protein [Stenotrophomonas sp. C3(2023)]
MKITNNHKGPLGLPDGTVLLPGVQSLVQNWEQLKKNSVVQGWVRANILIQGEAATAQTSSSATLLGSSILPTQVELVDGLTVQLSEVVRAAHDASGLSVEDWNRLDEVLREVKLADAIERLRSEAIADVDAMKGGAAGTSDSGEGSDGGGDADAGAGADGVPEDKGVLVAKAKALNIPGVGSHWGVGKLKEAIADAEAKKGEG